MINYSYYENFKKIIRITAPMNNSSYSGYNVYVADSFNFLSEACSKFELANKKVCIITDSNVAHLYLSKIKGIFDNLASSVVSITLEPGEKTKNSKTIDDLYSKLIEYEFNKEDFLVALGGGVIGDLTGYCASSFKRGINYIQIPTTLLAQVDASIGGKCAVDFNDYKNMVGAFYQPLLVYENVLTYKDLPREERINGMGEIIKSSLIYDEDFFKYLEDASTMKTDNFIDFLVNIVINSVLIKKYYIELDPYDENERHILNFGHTIGHAIEYVTKYEIKHGQAITLGMAVSMRIARLKGYISLDDEMRFAKTCVSYGLSISMNFTKEFIECIINCLSQDKKSSCDSINYILLEKIGKACIKKDITQEDILTAMNYK